MPISPWVLPEGEEEARQENYLCDWLLTEVEAPPSPPFAQGLMPSSPWVLPEGEEEEEDFGDSALIFFPGLAPASEAVRL
jgi:hypothetical protein